MDEGRRMILVFPTLIQFVSKEDRDLFAPRYCIARPAVLTPQMIPLLSSLAFMKTLLRSVAFNVAATSSTRPAVSTSPTASLNGRV